MDKIINNTSYMLTDLIHGDSSIDDREDYALVTGEEIQQALKLILTNPNLNDSQKKFYIENSWKIHYRGNRPPPNIDQFLTPYFLGQTATELYSYIPNILTEFWDYNKPYRHFILTPHIGWGKSFSAVITNLFLATHLILMKDPKKFFGLAKATLLSQVLISFSLDKASELLLEPFLQILESTDLFEKCRTVDSLHKRNKEFGVDKFFWTTASPTSAILFSNGVNIKLASSATKLLGVTIIMGTLSEISFFQERGFSQDEIIRVYNDLKKRIFSRFQYNYWARTILDSSPNDIENKIDNYIWNEAPKDSRNYIIKGTMWDWQPWKFSNVKDTFPIFVGSSSKKSKIISLDEVSEYDEKDIIHVPKEIHNMFEDDMTKALKDLAGIPAGAPDKLIQNKEKIEKMFTDKIPNIYTHIYAPYNLPPEQLIWDKIKDQFFIPLGNNRFQFHRYPDVERTLSVDQSITGDTTGIAMCHKEINLQGNTIYVIDFSIPIVPNKSRINLDAIKYFILDLRKYGSIRLRAVSFDRFQSENTMQFLTREGFEVERLSVDETVGPYMTLVNLLNTDRIKLGKNIYVKNNLKSLRQVETKTKIKIDHTNGKIDTDLYDTNWETSFLGYYAKDISDAIAASISLCDKYCAINTLYQYNFSNDNKDIKEEVFDKIFKSMALIKKYK